MCEPKALISMHETMQVLAVIGQRNNVLRGYPKEVGEQQPSYPLKLPEREPVYISKR